MSVEEFERTNRPMKNYRINEYMNNNPIVRPYYDYDHGTVDNIETTKPSVIDDLKAIMDKLHPGADVAYADRSGFKPKNGNVISLRAYVKGYKLRVTDIKMYIKQTFGKDIPDHLDLSIYKQRDQCLGVINAHKTVDDKRVLKPLTHANEKRAFLAQYLYGDEQEIVVERNESSLSKSVPRKSEDERSNNIDNRVQTININLQLDPSLIPEWEVMRLHLQQKFGFENLRQVRKTNEGYDFDANRSDNCCLCKVRCHDSNHWYCMQIMPELFMVKNYSNHCYPQMMELENMNYLKNIINSPKADADHANLISQIYGKVLRYTGKEFYVFQAGKWHKFHRNELRQCVRLTLVSVLERVAKYLNDRKLHLDFRGDDKSAVKNVIKEYQNVIHGIQYVKDDSNTNHIINCIQDVLIDKTFESRLDSNVHLFALDNGVIDLRTVKFRESVAEDMISMSAGYDWSDSVDLNIQNEFNQFIERIYPLEDERELIQRYLGYCLLGDHPEKVVMFLTDKRNGYNGKSTIAKLIKSAMGINHQRDDNIPSYVASGDCKLLYKAEKRTETANSHNTGMIKLRKTRLAIFEEPDPTYQLNNQLIKELHGGNFSFSGRDMNSNKEYNFIWGCKFLIMFNENNLPQMDVTDKPLLERALVMHHRARFFINEEEYMTHVHEPYTYRASNVECNFPQWRIYYLKWALDGLKRYWTENFRNIPSSCKELKEKLINSQDMIKHFLEDFCEDGTEDDVIPAKALYEAFARECQCEKDPKTRFGIRKFKSRVNELWNILPMEEKTIDRVKFYSAYVGKRFKQIYEST